MPLSRIKLDRQFVQSLASGRREDSSNQQRLLETIVGMAGNLGLTVTAEGVETPGQLEIVQRLGCHEVQGYLLGEPMQGGELSFGLGESSRHLGSH